MIRILVTALFLLISVATAQAVNPDEMLPDAAQEARARDISQNLRCLVCQNQSIDDSNAELAKDLRIIVRERIAAGDSNEQVLDYVVKRYGNYVLLKPPFQPDTALLWLLPFILMVLALGGAWIYVRQQPAPDEGEPDNDILDK